MNSIYQIQIQRNIFFNIILLTKLIKKNKIFNKIKKKTFYYYIFYLKIKMTYTHGTFKKYYKSSNQNTPYPIAHTPSLLSIVQLFSQSYPLNMALKLTMLGIHALVPQAIFAQS